MLSPGVGTLMLIPSAPVTVVRSAAPVAVERAAPPCRFTDRGMRLPPITRNATSPPKELQLLDAPFGFQLAIPAVRLRLARPREARAPNALPPPPASFGL